MGGNSWLLVGVPIGFLILRYNRQITEYIGSIGWAEEKLGAGGTYTLIKLIGLGMAIFCFAVPLGGCDGVFNKLSTLFRV